MPKPEEFTFQDHRFRHTPLPAGPLAREYDKLRIRLDHESGALQTLAYTLNNDELREMAVLDPNGVFRLVSLLSRFVDAHEPYAVEPAAEDDGAPLKPADKLPRTLLGLLLHYLEVGRVQWAVTLPGSDEPKWLDFWTEEQINEHPISIAPFACMWQVLRGLFAPFADPLRAWFDQAKAEQSSKSSNDNAELDEATALTSET